MAQAYTEQRDPDGEGDGRPDTLLGRLTRRFRRGGPPSGESHTDHWWQRGPWRRGRVLAGLAVLLALFLALHARMPNAVGNLGSLLETFLPWLGLGVPVLLLCGLIRKSATASVALILPVVAWLNLFGGLLTDKRGSGGDLTVVTHNVDADNADPAGTARDLTRSGAQVVALEEVSSRSLATYEKGLAKTYPYHTVKGTVGLWSKYPLSHTRTVDIKIGWARALRATVAAPNGELAVYVAHLPSVRLKSGSGFTVGQRDDSAAALGRAIESESARRVVLLGDLNGTMNDRSLAPVTSQLRSAQGAAGNGFGFSWPASFPMARIDQIMVRGVDPVSAWSLPATGSDHLPVAASVNL